MTKMTAALMGLVFALSLAAAPSGAKKDCCTDQSCCTGQSCCRR